MKPLQPLSLTQAPFQFVYRRSNGANYKDIIHLHEGIEFLYIEQGDGQVVVGQKTIRITDGMLLFFQPFQLHKFAIEATDERPFIRSFLVYDPAWLQPYLRAFPRLMEFHRLICKRSWDVQVLNGVQADHPLIRHLQRLSHLPTQDSATDRMEEQHVLYVLGWIDLLQQQWPRDNYDLSTVNTRAFGHAELAMEWIESNFMKPFNLQLLADHLHLSAPYLSGLFRREVGENLTDYLTARRIQEGCRLLMASTQSLDQIAYEIGIPNVSYFCQLFKKVIGETPRRFRMKSKGKDE